MESKIGPLLKSLTSVLETYLGLRTDDFKKNITNALATGFSRALAILVIVALLLIVLTVFAFAFIILIGDAIGSWSGAAFLVGGVYLVAVLILYLKRKTLFLNMFNNLFTSIIETNSSDDGWKTLLLIIVRTINSTQDPPARP